MGDGDRATSLEQRTCVVVIVLSERAGELAEALEATGCSVRPSDGIASVAALVATEEPAVVLVDDRDDGWLRHVADLVRVRPAVRPLALVPVEQPEQLLAALTAGVAGFVAPDAGVDAIVRTVRSVLDEGAAIPRGVVPMLVEHVRHGRGRRVRTAGGAVDVTDREWEILQLLVQRRTTREMATQLYVSVGTVRSHVSALLRKLGAVDREDAIRLVERGGD